MPPPLHHLCHNFIINYFCWPFLLDCLLATSNSLGLTRYRVKYCSANLISIPSSESPESIFFSRDLDTTKNVCHNFCVCDLTRAQFTVFSEFSNGPHTKVERELVIIPDSIHTYNTLRDTHAREKKRKTYAHLLGPCKEQWHKWRAGRSQETITKITK